MRLRGPLFLFSWSLLMTVLLTPALAAGESAGQGVAHPRLEHRYTQVAGHEIAYLDEGSGFPVMLIHGIPTNSGMWRKVIPVLAERFRVIAPDLLNYGRSAMPAFADVSINNQREILFELLDALGVGRAHVVAHDIGGGVAQLMAVDEPERIARLVLIDAVSFDSWPIPEFGPLQQPGAEADMALEEFLEMLRSFMPRGVVDTEVMSESVVDLYVEPWASAPGKRAFFRNLRRLNSEYTRAIADELPQLPHHTLIIWGEKDPFQKPEYAHRLNGAIPNSKLEIVDGVGHWLLEEKPDEITGLILEFLSED